MMGMMGMMGMSGVSGAGRMPRNCGMQRMHGNSQTKQTVKADDLAAKQQQTNQTTEITKGIQGSKVDIRI